MNTLIFGGLIAVAVVALIILVLVLMAEQRNQPAAATTFEVATPPAQAPAATPATPPAQQTRSISAQATAQLPKTTIPVPQPNFDQDYGRTSAFNGRQNLPETESLALIRIRGQLREITSELRLLYKQSSAFEQRLAALNEAANYVERMIVEQTNAEDVEETLS